GSPAVGVSFFAPDRFRDSSNAFAKISKTRPIGLKQFEIFTLRHLLNSSRKRSMSLQKQPPTLDFLGSRFPTAK
ncbi:MAG: hypothetical protein K9J85_06930, partial [Desulfobacteraceae bacterium]|nr:hypothetical protein [Desulfobacteraceae bacterium]